MKTYFLKREQRILKSIGEVFAFFADARNLEAITPAWLAFQILSTEPIVMRVGARIHYRLRWHRLPLRWHTEIQGWTPPRRFVDVQTRGPYRLWRHTHTFEPVPGGTLMRDVVEYALPLGPLGQLAHTWRVHWDLDAIFAYRAAKVSEILGADAHG
jgi:ligand-binding SRPBCC domain-containing protein